MNEIVNFKRRIREIVAEKTGLELENISDEQFLDADLNLSDDEIKEIIEIIEEELILDLTEEKKFIETVGDLTITVEEEID